MRRAMRSLALLAVSTAFLAGCSSTGTGSPAAGGGTAASARPTQALNGAPASGGPASWLRGRWEQDRRCQDLVGALTAYGLAPTIPAVIGDFFPDETPHQIAQKADPCAGAQPSPHSHFFDSHGRFGSLDAHMQQVDDGMYRVVNERTLEINGSLFHYEVTRTTLRLTPVITPTLRKKALSNPLGFSKAGWMVAVSYPGTTWRRVDCKSWC